MGGAHRGLGTSNDTVVLNPAGMALWRRYAVDLTYRYGLADDLTHLSVSAVDSKTGPVAGGLAYTHTRGDGSGADPSLHRIYLAAAYAITERLALGINGVNIRGTYREQAQPVAGGGQSDETLREVSLYSGGFGLSAVLEGGLTLGFVYNNAIKTREPSFAPPRVGAGFSFSSGAAVLAGDVLADIRDPNDKAWSYHVGGEYVAAQTFPLRIGYEQTPFTDADETRKDEKILTGGLGWLLNGGSLNASFQRSLKRQRNWSVAGSLVFFL